MKTDADGKTKQVTVCFKMYIGLGEKIEYK